MIKKSIMKKMKSNKKKLIKNNQITNLICSMLIVIINNDKINDTNLLNQLFINLYWEINLNIYK
jgi:hypothetical protein